VFLFGHSCIIVSDVVILMLLCKLLKCLRTYSIIHLHNRHFWIMHNAYSSYHSFVSPEQFSLMAIEDIVVVYVFSRHHTTKFSPITIEYIVLVHVHVHVHVCCLMF
jgi:hypothetical protein